MAVDGGEWSVQMSRFPKLSRRAAIIAPVWPGVWKLIAKVAGMRRISVSHWTPVHRAVGWQLADPAPSSQSSCCLLVFEMPTSSARPPWPVLCLCLAFFVFCTSGSKRSMGRSISANLLCHAATRPKATSRFFPLPFQGRSRRGTYRHHSVFITASLIHLHITFFTCNLSWKT